MYSNLKIIFLKKKIFSISIVIPTIGRKKLIKTLISIKNSSIRPKEILIVVPNRNTKKINFIKKFTDLNIKQIPSKRSNQVLQRIEGFKKSKCKFVLQLDDDVVLYKDCIKYLYKYINKEKNIAVSPRLFSNIKVSKIYKKPSNFLFTIYHWLINGFQGYSPGKISLSGFNYSDENHNYGTRNLEWLSGGAVMHRRENLIFKNYYPFKFDKSYCEDILHSIALKEKKIKLTKLYSAKAFYEEDIYWVIENNLKDIFKIYFNEFKVRLYIVNKLKKQKIRMYIYYIILLIRISFQKFKEIL